MLNCLFMLILRLNNKPVTDGNYFIAVVEFVAIVAVIAIIRNT